MYLGQPRKPACPSALERLGVVIFPTGLRLDGFGHYHETYARTDGGWRIASSTLSRLHQDFSGADA